MSNALRATLNAARDRQPEPSEVEEPAIEAPISQVKQTTAKKPSRAAIQAKAEPTGAKSTNPEFMQLKVYVRKTTKTAAARKWEDQGGGDVSDLIESLLTKYLSS